MAPNTRAHPHVCGEHDVYVSEGELKGGSSPRVWGAPRLAFGVQGPERLIPTCVGSTDPSSQRLRAGTAHPHVCGEHGAKKNSWTSSAGSSPRVWGARADPLQRSQTYRLIPTCVGSTLADMGFYPHTPSFRISLEPKASINPTRFLGLSPSGSAPIPASFAPPFSWP